MAQTENEITNWLIWGGKPPKIAFLNGPKPIKQMPKNAHPAEKEWLRRRNEK